MYRLIATFAAVALLAGPSEGGQTGASRTALAIVSDARNRPIVDVGADDFLVQEGGQTREVLSVRIADYPIVVMLDNGAEARSDFAMMRKAVERLIERLGPRPVAIGVLSDPPKLLTGFDADREANLGELANLDVRSSKSMMLMGAAAGGDAIRATGSLFSALIVLSSTPIDWSPSNTDPFIASIVDSRAVLHVIANRSATLMGTTPMGQVRSGPMLRSIAEQTRGEFTVIYSAASYQAALDRLAERLTTELMIEYLVPPGSKPVDARLGVRLPGAKVRGLGVAPRE